MNTFSTSVMKPGGSYFKRILLALFVVLVIAAGASGQKDGAALPEGAGRSLMLQACVQCHDFKCIVSQRKTAEAWRRTVNEMIWRGAPLLTDEASLLTDYLAAAFGPESVPLRHPPGKAAAEAPAQNVEDDLWAKYLPSGEGRPLVLQACMQCHGLKNIVARRATAASWRRSVGEMVKLGAQLTAGEAMIVSKYLADSFGPKVSIPEELKEKQ